NREGDGGGSAAPLIDGHRIHELVGRRRREKLCTGSPNDGARMRRDQICLRHNIAEPKLRTVIWREPRLISYWDDRSCDNVPIVIDPERVYRLDQQVVQCVVVRTGAEIGVVLEGNGDDIGDRVLRVV